MTQASGPDAGMADRKRQVVELVDRRQPGVERDTDKPRLVLVPGMHRSGTSAVASMLIANGGWAGDEEELVGPAPANAAGFFERRDLVALHEEWLQRLGGSWDSPPGHFDYSRDGAAVDGASRYLQNLLIRRPSGTGLVLKDPRMALFLRAWLAAQPDAVVVLPVRHPVEVAESLWERDSIPIGHAVAMWQKYTLESLAALRGRRVIVVNFSRLAASRPEELHRAVADMLTLVWRRSNSDQLRETLQLDLVKQTMHTEGMELLERQMLPVMVRQLWDGLNGLPVVAETAADDLLGDVDPTASWWAVDRCLSQWRDAGRTLTQLRQTELKVAELEAAAADGVLQSDRHAAQALGGDGREVELLEKILAQLQVAFTPQLGSYLDDVNPVPRDGGAILVATENPSQLTAASQRQGEVEAELEELRVLSAEQELSLDEQRACVARLLDDLQARQDLGDQRVGDAAQRLEQATHALAALQNAFDEAISTREIERARDAGALSEETQRRRRAEEESMVAADEIARLREAIAAGEDRVAELVAALEASTTARDIDLTVDALVAELLAVKAQLDAEREVRLDLESSLRQAKVAELEIQQTLSGMTRNYRYADQQLREVLTSRSWRLTRPLREAWRSRGGSS